MRFDFKFDVNKLSHLRTVGKVGKIFFPTNADEVQQAYMYTKENDLQPFPLGNGSNTLIGYLEKIVLVSDRKLHSSFWGEAYPTQIARDILGEESRTSKKRLEIVSIGCEGDGKLILSASININLIIMHALRLGLGGLEFLAGIPANLGGLICMNAGANGRTISEFVEWVDLVNEDGETRLLFKDIEFGYRHSKINGFIIRACLRLNSVDKETHYQVIKTAVAKRKAKQPLTMPNLGCYFKNPTLPSYKGEGMDCHVPLNLSQKGNESAGYLIEQAGLKSFKIGGAMISPLHANFLVNTGGAKFEDFIALAEYIKGVVNDKFSIMLQEEVKVING